MVSTMARPCSTIAAAAASLLLLALAGCGLEPSGETQVDGRPVSQGGAGAAGSAAPAFCSPDAIRIASFNIQVFGQSKLGKPQVMSVLADVVRRYDVVAIQEVRSKEQNVLPDFLAEINSQGAKYDFVLGPRQGRTVSQEQYAYVYNTARIEFVASSSYVTPDPHDLLHRPPFVASFRVRGPPETAFSFTLANIHTDPDETNQELDALADVYQAIRQSNPQEDDLILLGDLNVDEYHLGRLGKLPGIRYVIGGQPTNTRLNKTYDNLIFDGLATSEFRGKAGVLNLMETFGLGEEQALQVSDHMPVWAEFSATEVRGTGPVAGLPGATSR